MDITQKLEDQIRQEVIMAGFNPAFHQEKLQQVIENCVNTWEQAADQGHVSPLRDRQATIDQLLSEFCGYGKLQPLMDDPQVEEIWLNSGSQVFCSRGGQSELTNLLLSDQEVREIVERMLRSSGRHVDFSSPFVDATLATGERLHVAIPPVTARAWAVNIRKHKVRARRLNELTKLGMITQPAASFLDKAVELGLNIVVSGPTQAGKTTFARALCGSIPASARIISCEEVFELGLSARDVVALQTRPASLEGHGEITLRHLVKESLRMRPERIIIGEVRGAESLDMLIGLNCGIPGLTTIHANSARQALSKLCTLPLLAGENVDRGFVTPTVAAVIDLVVQLAPAASGRRHVEQIVAVVEHSKAEQIQTVPIFENQNGTLQVGQPFDFTAKGGTQLKKLQELYDRLCSEQQNTPSQAAAQTPNVADSRSQELS